jgi:hypothetical protein
MKLDKSFLGGMLGIAGFQVGLTLLDRYLNGPAGERFEYSDDAVRDMIAAAGRGDLRGFTRVYRAQRPKADDFEVYEKYTSFCRILKEG